MYLLFSDSPGIGPLVIKWFTRSKWSHVDIVLDSDLNNPDAVLIGALAKTGVTKYKLKERLAHAKRAKAVKINVTPTMAEPALEWLEAQVGKDYDWGAIFFAIGLNRNWQSEENWFCSELGGTFADKCGMPVVDAEVYYRVTPQDIYNSPFPKITVR
jgi:uncharacterized protein YycO